MADTGCSAAWLARLLWEQEAGSSNLPTPTSVCKGSAMTRIRSTLAGAVRNTLSEQLDLEPDHQRDLIPLNLAEGAAPFVEKRDADFSPAR